MGHSYKLTSALASLGRYAGNTIVISDETISRHHARLRRTEQGYTIEDLNSANGVFVNQERVTSPRALAQGDVIRLGQLVELQFEVSGPAGDAAENVALMPAFDDSKPFRPVSDTGGTVYMKAVSTIGREEPKPAASRGRAWMWILVAAGVALVAAVAYFALVAGH
jgi:predicted component of type VI protein secretion system